MTDEELIEQVARAICDADQWCGLYDRLGDDERSVYQRDARAILPIIKAERAATIAKVVAWLRETWRTDMGVIECLDIADAIEAGDHLK